MRKLSLLFGALLGMLATACTSDPTDPDLVDPWLRERTPESLRLAGQIGAAVITDDWRHDDQGAISVQLVVDDISHVEVVELKLRYNATADIAAGDFLDLSSGSATFTVTAETGETRAYTLTYNPFVEELEGVYSMDPLEHGLLDDYGPSPYVLVGGFDGNVVVFTPQDKSWQWGDGYQPNDEADNVFSFKLESVDAVSGTTYGTCANLAGEDGNYANYVFANRIDVNEFYRLIPKGRSRWAKNVEGEISFYAWEDTEYTAPVKTVKQIGAGDHTFWDLTVPISEFAFYCEYPGPFNVEMDNWGDERFMALNVRDVFWRMKRDSDEPLPDHNAQLDNLGGADKPAAPVGAWLKAITFEGQIGTTELDDEAGTVAVRLLMDDVADIAAVEILTLELNPSVTADVAAGDRIDLSSGSATFTATATNGDTRTYTVTYTEFEKPATIEGTYRFSPIGGLLSGDASPSSVVIVGGWDYDDGPEVVMSTAMDKSWHWGDGYQPNDEEDNVISFKIDRIEEDGTTYGTLVNYAGADGKYANYVYENTYDVNYFYRVIPEGRSRWSQQGDVIRIYAYDDTAYKKPVKTIGQLEAGSHDFWGKSVPVAETAFYCDYPGPYDVIDWNWLDTRWMVDNIRDIFWLMTHASGDPLENHDELLETLPDFVMPENPKPAVVSFAGVYDMDYNPDEHWEGSENGDGFALWFFGGSNDGAFCQSLMWKHWNWGDGYKPWVEDDNVLTIEQTGSDPDTGDEWGTCYNDAGPDGKYADFWWWDNGGHDLKKFYRCIPEGSSTWRKDGATGRITFTAEDGTAHTATYYSEPTTITYEQDGKSFDCVVHYQALEFDVAGTPMEGWTNYSDYDKYVQNPMKFIVKLKKRE